MKSKYMDFVPVKGAKKVTQASKKVVKVNPVTPKVVEKTEVTFKEARVVRPSQKVAFSHETTPKLGVIEDLKPTTVAKITKRPLGAVDKPDLAKIKAKPVGNKAATTEKKPTPKPQATKKSDKQTYKTPKSPFINQEKVEKRPLSKNVYKKATPAHKEEPKGPVTIIEKPEKDAKAGLVITIILTIILGAAAGTIAFLLLPK